MHSFTVMLDAADAQPMYEQLYKYIIREISSGNIKTGDKLPSKRTLSAELSVSVNTVDTAYQMLLAEGYVESRPRSGYYICPLDALPTGHENEIRSFTELPKTVSAIEYDFSTSSVDTALFPYKAWGRIEKEILADGDTLLNHGERQGDRRLRDAIAEYLHEFRAVRCAPEQIIIGAGVEYLMGQLAAMLKELTFALEDPGYNRIGSILKNCGVNSVYVPVDNDGLKVSELGKSHAQVVCVTPSHQFPTGATMPMGRRTALLSWARRADDRYVIEDDYDSEFRFDRKPIPALQGIDRDGKVIYMGTFSKSLAPSIRAAYMVLPSGLYGRYQTMFQEYSSTVSRFEQHTIAGFIEKGHFARHLARLRVAYRSRRDALVQGLVTALGEENIEIRGAHTGLHLLLTVKGNMTEQQLVELAKQQGVGLTGISRFYIQNPPEQYATVVLGYSALDEPHISEACKRLSKAWKDKL